MKPEWTDKATDDLADIWVAATLAERNEIERAVLHANRKIGDDPENAGESRGGTARVFVSPPVTVWYRVRPNGQARVFGIRHHRPQP